MQTKLLDLLLPSPALADSVNFSSARQLQKCNGHYSSPKAAARANCLTLGCNTLQKVKVWFSTLIMWLITEVSIY